jgi:predicted nucleic acid-binding protein
MSATRVVLDASAFMRAAWASGPDEEASSWVERIVSGQVEALAPDLLYAEVANGLLGDVRAAVLDLASAAAILDVLLQLPVRTTSLSDLAIPALRIAHARGLSAYDACYVVLAEQADATLLTADRGAAAAAADSILLH